MKEGRRAGGREGTGGRSWRRGGEEREAEKGSSAKGLIGMKGEKVSSARHSRSHGLLIPCNGQGI